MSSHFDTIIVGAGSAGGVLAARLSEDPERSVLLIDAGPDFADPSDIPSEIVVGRANGIGVIADAPSTPDDYIWRFPAQANAEQSPGWYARGRLVGGSSAVNGQVFIRALPEDFDRWVAAGNDRWGYPDVLPFYRALETHLDIDDEYHGRTGPIRVRRYPEEQWCAPSRAFYTAARARGFPHCDDDNRPGTTGIGPATHNNADDERQSVLTTYLRQSRDRPNLTILPRTTVHRVDIERGRAVAVRVVTDGQSDRIEAGEIVLSAGALASPQLLMLSGIGPADDLRRLGIDAVVDLAGVGSNLGEHPYVHLLWRAHPDMARPSTDPGHPTVLRFTTAGSTEPNDAKIYFLNSVPVAVGSGLDPTGLVGSLCSLDLVYSRGWLQLRRPDIAQEPIVRFNLLQDPSDLHRMSETVQLMLDLVRSPEMAHVIAAPHGGLPDGDLARWLLRHAQPAMHACGTCAMGPESDPAAVVDQEGRVYGVEGLRVVDASILPDVPRANLNATVMMLGERIASFMTT
jgi:choline dehydrogenase